MRPGRRECDNPAMSESPYERGTTHFGFRDVAAKDKQKLVGGSSRRWPASTT